MLLNAHQRESFVIVRLFAKIVELISKGPDDTIDTNVEMLNNEKNNIVSMVLISIDHRNHIDQNFDHCQRKLNLYSNQTHLFASYDVDRDCQ